ncbi:longitudinals lacking protein, isoforms H/M/V-like isoform X2 [Thrips palmi]|uniref:Longitudinals lacking protein, isoforms H/M/V-like isoform X2 n=1 Tax=Thrips palmi TaxID=161013 RepID=A0A6P8ZXW5_THRPL|nr:longitudinals lacking protein, isoforms H/M/V-like isoform X2 [Thrips palmi]
MADQQFCLRWNNHQSTLISVFDSLLERGAMVDCTLAAEGQCLQAHKVVLSACSPYLETLLSQHYDKHPILLLKDVKFYELQAMMDYMYRGEVNVAQDKLGMFLKAAESLQIKGLSDSGGNEPPDTGGGTSSKRTSKAVPVTNIPRSGGGLTVERRRPQPQVSQVVDIPSDSGSRDGSESPSLRRKRRRRTSGDENTAEGDSSNTGDVSRTQPSSAPLSSDQVPMNGSADSNALGILSSLMDGTVETDNSVQEPGPSLGSSSQTQPSQRIREKLEPTSAEMIQPKAEYLETEENVEDLTLDDDDDTGMDAGPSQRQGAGYQWHMGDQSADEVFMAAQEAVGANRDAQGDVFHGLERNVILEGEAALDSVLNNMVHDGKKALDDNAIDDEMEQRYDLGPLPVSYSLPHFPLHITNKIKHYGRKIDAKSKKEILDILLNDMVRYSCHFYPKDYEYQRVAERLVTEYPDLADASTNAAFTWKRAIISSFHKYRRKHAQDPTLAKFKEKLGIAGRNFAAGGKRTDKLGARAERPCPAYIESGVSDTSPQAIEQIRLTVIQEWSKDQPNIDKILLGLKLTARDRCLFFRKHGTSLTDGIQMYPLLKDPFYINDEMVRLYSRNISALLRDYFTSDRCRRAVHILRHASRAKEITSAFVALPEGNSDGDVGHAAVVTCRCWTPCGVHFETLDTSG